MRAWVAPAPGAPPEPLERPRPALGPDELLVEVEAAAFAAPELALLDAGTGFAPGRAAGRSGGSWRRARPPANASGSGCSSGRSRPAASATSAGAAIPASVRCGYDRGSTATAPSPPTSWRGRAGPRRSPVRSTARYRGR